RMGLTPGYAFTFAVAQQNGDGLDPIPPRRIENSRRAEGDIDWLLANIMGDPVPRSSESGALVDPKDVQTAALSKKSPNC
ncbi:MAG: hypothetical protein AAF530_25800, partial [Pseudomonadota bacterium]